MCVAVRCSIADTSCTMAYNPGLICNFYELFLLYFNIIAWVFNIGQLIVRTWTLMVYSFVHLVDNQKFYCLAWRWSAWKTKSGYEENLYI